MKGFQLYALRRKKDLFEKDQINRLDRVIEFFNNLNSNFNIAGAANEQRICQYKDAEEFIQELRQTKIGDLEKQLFLFVDYCTYSLQKLDAYNSDINKKDLISAKDRLLTDMERDIWDQKMNIALIPATMGVTFACFFIYQAVSMAQGLRDILKEQRKIDIENIDCVFDNYNIVLFGQSFYLCLGLFFLGRCKMLYDNNSNTLENFNDWIENLDRSITKKGKPISNTKLHCS